MRLWNSDYTKHIALNNNKQELFDEAWTPFSFFRSLLSLSLSLSLSLLVRRVEAENLGRGVPLVQIFSLDESHWDFLSPIDYRQCAQELGTIADERHFIKILNFLKMFTQQM